MSVESQTKSSGQTGGIRQRLQRLFMRSHVTLYRLTGGKLGGGASYLILTTTGRKSGIERDTPLFFFADGGNFIVIASNAGAAKHPIWWLNLQNHPQAKVQIKSRVIPVTAIQADVEERKRLWELIGIKYKQFLHYQERTAREIPVVILIPEM